DRLHIALVRPQGYLLVTARISIARRATYAIPTASDVCCARLDGGGRRPERTEEAADHHQYADLAKLPDWSGVWDPKISDQDQQARNNPPPWNEKVAKEVEKMWAEEKAGRPKLIFYGCFPEAHPSWMLVTHNAMEILFTPGRVTMLGESDGNR